MKKYLALAFSIFVLFLMNQFGFMDRILDARFYYTGPEANEYLAGLTVAARAAYLRQEYLDQLFILSYSLTLYLFLRGAFTRAGAYLAFVPGVFDLIETFGVIYLLKVDGAVVPDWLGLVTGLKWTSGALVGFYLVSGLVQRSYLRQTRA